jgi:hypothetical protein
MAIGAVLAGVGKAAQGGLMLGQAIAGAVQRKQADALVPGPGAYDQKMYNMLRSEITSRKNAALGVRGAALRKLMKTTSGNMMKGGRIDYGTLNAMQNQMAENAMATNESALANYYTLLQKQSTDIQDFANERQLLMSTRKDARSAANMQAFNQNIGPAIANLTGADDLLSKKTQTA